MDSPVEIINADLATVTSEADMVPRVSDPEGPYLLHMEFQAGYDRTVDGRVLRYNVLLEDRHQLPVESVVILLRPGADGAEVLGRVDRGRVKGFSSLAFRYRLIRLWQLSVDELLSGKLGTLPFVPLTKVSRRELPEVVHRMQERISQEAAPSEANELWSATYVLMGLRYPTEYTDQILQGVRQMRESVTYQAILEEGRKEGRADEARNLVLRLGTQRFGPPDPAMRSAIDAEYSVERLEALADSMLRAESWEELLR
jgi:predicted transposase YdaD